MVRRVLDKRCDKGLPEVVTRLDPAVQSELNQNQRRTANDAKSYRGSRNFQRELAKAELEMELDGKKIVKYRTTTKIYFDIEK